MTAMITWHVGCTDAVDRRRALLISVAGAVLLSVPPGESAPLTIGQFAALITVLGTAERDALARA